jgi:ankyrin repeat protein
MGCKSSAPVPEVKEPEPEPPKPVDFKSIHSKVRWNRDFDDIKEAIFSVEAANCVDPGNGNCPIHIAAQNGHAEVTKLLIDCGANVNAQNAKGNTAFHMALSYDYEKCVKLLVDAGADLSIQNAAGHPAYRGLDGDKSTALLALSTAKSAEEIKAAFALCESKKEEMDKAGFVNSGLKAKKTVGTTVWTSEIQDEFKKIMDSLP